MTDGSPTILKPDGSPEPVKTYTLEPASYEDVEPRPGWRAASLSDLEWCLERMGEAQRIMAENAALAEEAIGRIRARLAALNASQERTAQYFEAQAKCYAETARVELLGKGKKKSRDLPSGSVGWRKSGGGLVVTDEAACLEWAKAQDDLSLVRVKVELSKTALKDRFKATGECPPGCDIEPESETLYVKPVVPEVVLGGVEQKRLEAK
jgi:phage host-nuclease inhibitor protein Gam